MRVQTKKPRNSGTMTESAFWSMIRSTLRRKSMFWKPIMDTLISARRVYTGSNKRRKWEYQCAVCSYWFSRDEVEVDHIIESGTLTCAEDLPRFIETLFSEEDNLQVLCTSCHSIKTRGHDRIN